MHKQLLLLSLLLLQNINADTLNLAIEDSFQLSPAVIEEQAAMPAEIAAIGDQLPPQIKVPFLTKVAQWIIKHPGETVGIILSKAAGIAAICLILYQSKSFKTTRATSPQKPTGNPETASSVKDAQATITQAFLRAKLAAQLLAKKSSPQPVTQVAIVPEIQQWHDAAQEDANENFAAAEPVARLAASTVSTASSSATVFSTVVDAPSFVPAATAAPILPRRASFSGQQTTPPPVTKTRRAASLGAMPATTTPYAAPVVLTTANLTALEASLPSVTAPEPTAPSVTANTDSLTESARNIIPAASSATPADTLHHSADTVTPNDASHSSLPSFGSASDHSASVVAAAEESSPHDTHFAPAEAPSDVLAASKDSSTPPARTPNAHLPEADSLGSDSASAADGLPAGLDLTSIPAPAAANLPATNTPTSLGQSRSTGPTSLFTLVGLSGTQSPVEPQGTVFPDHSGKIAPIPGSPTSSTDSSTTTPGAVPVGWINRIWQAIPYFRETKDATATPLASSIDEAGSVASPSAVTPKLSANVQKFTNVATADNPGTAKSSATRYLANLFNPITNKIEKAEDRILASISPF
jgi:hypothetical protein